MTLEQNIAARPTVILSEENDALIEENKRLKADSSFAWFVVTTLVLGIIGWVAVMPS